MKKKSPSKGNFGKTIIVAVVLIAICYLLASGPMNQKQYWAYVFIASAAFFFVFAFLVLPGFFRVSGAKSKESILKAEEAIGLTPLREKVEDALNLPLVPESDKKKIPQYDEERTARHYLDKRLTQQ